MVTAVCVRGNSPAGPLGSDLSRERHASVKIAVLHTFFTKKRIARHGTRGSSLTNLSRYVRTGVTPFCTTNAHAHAGPDAFFVRVGKSMAATTAVVPAAAALVKKGLGGTPVGAIPLVGHACMARMHVLISR
jgi:hypothetical protein